MSDPTPAGDIGNSHTVTDKEAGSRLLQLVVHGAVQTTRLVNVAVNSVLNLLGSVAWGKG